MYSSSCFFLFVFNLLFLPLLLHRMHFLFIFRLHNNCCCCNFVVIPIDLRHLIHSSKVIFTKSVQQRVWPRHLNSNEWNRIAECEANKKKRTTKLHTNKIWKQNNQTSPIAMHNFYIAFGFLNATLWINIFVLLHDRSAHNNSSAIFVLFSICAIRFFAVLRCSYDFCVICCFHNAHTNTFTKLRIANANRRDSGVNHQLCYSENDYVFGCCSLVSFALEIILCLFFRYLSPIGIYLLHNAYAVRARHFQWIYCTHKRAERNWANQIVGKCLSILFFFVGSVVVVAAAAVFCLLCRFTLIWKLDTVLRTRRLLIALFIIIFVFVNCIDGDLTFNVKEDKQKKKSHKNHEILMRELRSIRMRSQTKSKIVWAFLRFRYALPLNAASDTGERLYTERHGRNALCDSSLLYYKFICTFSVLECFFLLLLFSSSAKLTHVRNSSVLMSIRMQ